MAIVVAHMYVQYISRSTYSHARGIILYLHRASTLIEIDVNLLDADSRTILVIEKIHLRARCIRERKGVFVRKF